MPKKNKKEVSMNLAFSLMNQFKEGDPKAVKSKVEISANEKEDDL